MSCLHIVRIKSNDGAFGGLWRCCHPTRKNGTCAGYKKCSDYEEETEHERLLDEANRKRLRHPMRKLVKAIGMEETRGEEKDENMADTIDMLADNLEGND